MTGIVKSCCVMLIDVHAMVSVIACSCCCSLVVASIVSVVLVAVILSSIGTHRCT